MDNDNIDIDIININYNNTTPSNIKDRTSDRSQGVWYKYLWRYDSNITKTMTLSLGQSIKLIAEIWRSRMTNTPKRQTVQVKREKEGDLT